MESEKDLSGPTPVSNKRIGDPKGQPKHLVYTLYDYAQLAPSQGAFPVKEELLKRKGQHGAAHHGAVDHSQLEHLLLEQIPLLELQGISSLSQVSEHACEHHNRKTDPEEYKEASKVMIVTLRVEVGHAIHVFISGEHALLLLGADLPARRR